jgi:hypothetical protein
MPNQRTVVKEFLPNDMVDTTNTKCSSGGAPADKAGAGAPGEEIEITPAMIAAGIEVLRLYDIDAWESSSAERVAAFAERIFLEMSKTMRQESPSDPAPR